MKVTLKNGVTSTLKVVKDYTKNLLDKGITLKTLVKDTFSKKIDKVPSNVHHKGDVYEHVPEFIVRDGDTAGMKVRNMKFSKEETEKMSKMSLDEMMEHKAKLIEKGKYTYEE